MKKWILLIGYLIMWWILLSRMLPDFIEYDKTGTFGWIIFILIFIGLPYLLNVTLAEFKVERKLGLLFAISSVFLGVVYGLVVGESERKELTQQGKITKGIIYKKWRSRGKWLVRAEYFVEQRRYETATKNKIFEKDTVTIIYSALNPELSEIEE